MLKFPRLGEHIEGAAAMTHDELRALVAEVQARQSELDSVEVKAARGGTPKRLFEPFCAFANRPGGGVVLFGLKEDGDFTVVGVGDTRRLQEEITHLASNEIEPALRPRFTVDEIEGKTVVAVEIDEVSAARKPCFHKQAGLPKGAYLRVGNTNRQMTEYEVFGYLSARGQPVHDEEIVPHATIEDLDPRSLNEYLDKLRADRPHAAFLAGPREEAIANAVAHRDYSPYVRGSHIRIRMFADRLEVQSPGGLFGNVTVENLEDEQSTRNTRPMRMMEDVHLVENRGSGIRAMLRSMRKANLEPPRFEDNRASFQVTFHNHTLLNPETIAWLSQFAPIPLNDRQRHSLAYLRLRPQVTNSEYRRMNHVDTLTAGSELRGLVQAGFVEQRGTGRWTTYALKVSANVMPPVLEKKTDEAKILAYVRERGSINNAECRTLLGADQRRTQYLLMRLVKGGSLKPERSGRWRRYLPG